MKRTLKWTVLAVAISAAAAANADVVNNVENNVENNWTTNTTLDTDIDYSDSFDRDTTITHDVDTSYSDSFDRDTTITHDVDTSYSDSFDKTTTIDKSYSDSFDKTTTIDKSHSESFDKNTTIDKNVDLSLTADVNYERNISDTDITYDDNTNVNHNTNIDKAVDEHGVSAELESDLSLTSDIDFTGAPTVSGDLEIDSAAIAVVDNRQTNAENVGENEAVTDDASIGDNTATAASGNLQFNVAAGDNNQQDNAAALSAADASFAFGLADSKVLVQQNGVGNQTTNVGQTNTAGVSGAAFADASGNIGVNVTSGNNNQQKNSLAASVATSKYASAAVSSNQVSAGNTVSNAPLLGEGGTTEVQISLQGAITGSLGVGRYEGTGNSYQKDNFYLDTWDGALPHENGETTGHIDMDGDIQNAVDNPYADGVGGIAFDTDEEGTLVFGELGSDDLMASLSGVLAVPTSETVVAATNTATLSGDAFARASGNIGVNVSAGTGNQQANSLSLAVAQPSTGGGGGGGE